MDGFQSIREKKGSFFCCLDVAIVFCMFFFRGMWMFFVTSCPTRFMTQVCGDSIELEL